MELSGFHSVCAQHEIDHLNGITLKTYEELNKSRKNIFQRFFGL